MAIYIGGHRIKELRIGTQKYKAYVGSKLVHAGVRVAPQMVLENGILLNGVTFTGNGAPAIIFSGINTRNCRTLTYDCKISDPYNVNTIVYYTDGSTTNNVHKWWEHTETYSDMLDPSKTVSEIRFKTTNINLYVTRLSLK